MTNDYSVFEKYLNILHIFQYEEVPTERDLFILGAEDFKDNISRWLGYLNDNYEEHPNAYINYILGSCKRTATGQLDSYTGLNIFDRFHGVCKKIRKEDFEFCFQYFNVGERPFIVVKQEWVDSLKNDTYSIYCMIDISGIKKYLEKNRVINADIINHYRIGLNKIAETNPDFTFITFTDNIFIKSDWKSTHEEYKRQYNPERLLLVIKDISKIIQETYGLESYAIVTQGVQLFQNNDSYNRELPSNHLFIGSIATPFIEIFDIERTIKKLRKNNSIVLKNLYLSTTLLFSLKIKSYDINKSDIGITHKYLSNDSGVSEDSFVSVDLDELLELIKI